MKTIHLIFGIHNHQPVGNFDFICEEAYRKSYAPFLEILQQFPSVRITMHYTGIIFDWLDRHYPEMIGTLKSMVQSGQVEMIGGGFYEPILAVIPDCDKLGQIKKLSQYVKDKTGAAPEGMWMAERIWEPHLPKIIRQAGLGFTILDDTHFQYAGLKEQDLYGYYNTEEDGHVVSLFPISKKLRYTIPFQEPEKTIGYLESIASEDGNRIAVFADDGEKFGVWPGTFKHCYTEGWLERFFTLLQENQNWIKMIHFGEAIRNISPVGRIYLPTASYAEMQHWALPVKSFQEYEEFENKLKHLNVYDEYSIYVRGGFWRNFMAKYDEANRMHKKMMRISKRVQLLKAVTAQTHLSAENIEMMEMAQDHVWAAQCNCPYWHGVFGGIYLNHIRYAIYRHLLLAEKLMDSVEYNDNHKWQQIQLADYNGDGHPEMIIETQQLNLYLHPHQGAGLFEMDYKAAPINLCDTMTRREEGYHRKLIEYNRMKAERKKHSVHTPSGQDGEIPSIHDMVTAKEENLDRFLIYDRNARQSLVDRLLPVHTTLDKYYREEYQELYPLAGSRYEAENQSTDDEVRVLFTKEIPAECLPLMLSKQITLVPGTSEMNVEYDLVHTGSGDLEFLFGTEFNITLLAGNADNRYYYVDGGNITDRKLNSIGEWGEAESMGMIDEWLNIDWRLAWTKKTGFWRFPVETISLSEEGFERVYQNSCVFPFWKIKLKPNQRWNVSINMSIKRFA